MVLKCQCGGTVIENEGEAACSRCGMVHETVPDGGPAWSETVRPTVFNGYWRLYRLDRMVSRPHEKTEILIESICQKCGVPDVVYKRSMTLHSMVVAHNLHLGWNLEARIAAVVTLACRLEGIPRTTKTICEAAGVKTGQAHHIYSRVVAGLRLSVPPPDPAAFVGSIATACNIPELARRRAVNLLVEHNKDLYGKDPSTLAAAALYMACDEFGHDISQQSIADAAHVSTVSLRLRRQDLLDVTGKLNAALSR